MLGTWCLSALKRDGFFKGGGDPPLAEQPGCVSVGAELLPVDRQAAAGSCCLPGHPQQSCLRPGRLPRRGAAKVLEMADLT